MIGTAVHYETMNFKEYIKDVKFDTLMDPNGGLLFNWIVPGKKTELDKYSCG